MEDNIKYCPKCGAENNGSAAFCSSCGTKFQDIQNTETKGFSFKKIIPIIIFVLIGLFLLKSTLEVNYYNNCIEATQTMLQGAAEAETTCNEIVSVWNNSIWKKSDSETNKYTQNSNGKFFDDFNDALQKYADDSKYESHIRMIMNNQNDVSSIMENIRHGYSGKYKDIGNKVIELYDYYIEFTNLPIYMNGSLNSFSEDFNKIDNEFNKQYQKIIAYFK